MLQLASSFVSFLQFFFAPHHSPWWAGAVWGNVIAIVPCGLLGVLWARAKFWPLNLIHRRIEDLHDKHDALAASHADLHVKLDALHEKHDQLQQALAGGSGLDPSKVDG